MRIGVDYYPEHWDQSLWAKDADLMKKTGVQIVRLAEFAWSRMEPRDGEFCFKWLDEAIEIFAERGIEVVLCTPTSCPPLWLYEQHPEAIQVGDDGQRIAIGVRGHRCINNEALRFYAKRFIEKMASHYADNKAVTAWQIDNELEAYFCFCETCNEKFRSWLKDKYGTLEAINKAYGNAVWSGEYSAWSQIRPPFGSFHKAWLNPAMMLDYYRWASENVIEFSDWQAELIRKHCPGRPVTTNVWFCDHMPDFYKQFENLDFIAYDNYPTTKIPKDYEDCYTHAFHLDLMRGVKQAPFWIMEQLSGGMGCWAPMTRMPEPGMIPGYALQAFAHGADTVIMFRWRTANIGAEMHWHGLLDHSNVPGRRFREFEVLCKTAKEWEWLQGASIKSEVAVLLSFENEYAFKQQPQTEGYYYLEQLQRLHRAFTALGMNVDIVDSRADLNSYKIVCAPELYVLDETVAENLHAYAEQGGIVIMTTRSGVKDIHNNAIMDLLPTVYRDMVGAYVTEYDPIGADTVDIQWKDGTSLQGKQWCDVLEVETAEVLARYDSEYFKGTPAVTRNAYGSGQVYYIAAVGKQGLYDKLVKDLVMERDLEWIPNLPDRVEITTRILNEKKVRFIFNNSDESKTCVVDGQTLTLEPFAMDIRGI